MVSGQDLLSDSGQDLLSDSRQDFLSDNGQDLLSVSGQDLLQDSAQGFLSDSGQYICCPSADRICCRTVDSGQGCRVVVSMISFLSVQFKMVFMRSEKPICAPPTLRSFLNVAFETVPVFVRLTMDLSFF